METFSEKPRLRSLLSHFSAVTDAGGLCLASCYDYDDMVEWGEAHLAFLRRYLPYHHGIPCPDWLRTLMNRIDPSVFSACFVSWASEWRPDAPQFKTSRRSHEPRGRQGGAALSVCFRNQ